MIRWTESVDLSSAWVRAFGPRVCARHGEPAEDLRSVTLRPKMPPWIWVCAVAIGGALGFACGVLAVVPVAFFAAIVDRQVRKPMKVPGWPYCPRCFALHRVYVIGTAAVMLGLVAYGLGFAVLLRGILQGTSGAPSGKTVALMGAGSLLALAGVVTRPWFSWPKLAGAHVSRDHRSVRVVAHGRFAVHVRERLAAGAGPRDVPGRFKSSRAGSSPLDGTEEGTFRHEGTDLARNA